MAISPGLQINVSQQLKLTPQLQQSIKILQYSALEVQQTIAASLETNFMLELDTDLEAEQDELDNLEDLAENSNSETDQEAELGALPDIPDLDLNSNEISDDSFDAEYSWDTLNNERLNTQSSDSDEYESPENYTAKHTSLNEHLIWQVETYSWQSELQQLIAYYLVDQINDDGFLTTTLPSILNTIKSSQPDLVISLADLEQVLEQVQEFEPDGVGARDLAESLLIQLRQFPENEITETANHLIAHHFDWLSNYQHAKIKKNYALDEDELTALLRFIQRLNPRPGREFAAIDDNLIVPDLRLKRSKNGWLVELNPDAFPRVSINQSYIDLTKNLKDNQQLKQVREQLAEARGLIKSIQSRGETLLKVGSYIVEKQQEFFEIGEQAMQPLVLREVADFLDLHESTISRATNQKYMQTPRGTFELKYFFSSSVSQDGYEEQSAVSIKAHIKDLIDEENPQKPLSDKKIMELLEEKDIQVARRTISKYREAMGIPSSSERRKLGRFR